MLVKLKKNGFKKISDELMFEYSNLEFLSIFKEFKSLLSSDIPWRINYIQAFAFWMNSLRGESHIDFRTQSVIMTLRGGAITNDILKFGKIIEFQSSWIAITVNELCTRVLRTPSLCPSIAHIHRWTLWKNHPSPVFISKMRRKQQKYTHTHTHTHTHRHKHTNTQTQATIQRKLEISRYNIQF